MLTVITEAHKEELHMSTRMSLSSLNIIPALEVKKKTQQMNRSANLWSTYLQQFKQYPLPLVPLPLKTVPQLCRSPQPLQPKYNPVPLLEEQVCQEEAEEAHQEEVEEAHLEEVEEAYQEEETLTNLPKEMENLWVHYQQSLKEIAWKLRASSENSPPIS